MDADPRHNETKAAHFYFHAAYFIETNSSLGSSFGIKISSMPHVRIPVSSRALTLFYRFQTFTPPL